ncbi:transcriptional regulator [Burkholderia lata]|uniref:winged helix-turn-helix domain-containing protein n=1 Tax=Burkholderia lata (strain ATCC 17760 / DSM 23089 / LMG 22485 / NCIMB 9086 / R18194 / 383) TaxID=482957 RepID=UPI0014530282|nr:winged helix-turn-helix domain-containing protein [Burkholderia lata]VWD54098.1 transcriptional regulator [Burkholderia lata]
MNGRASLKIAIIDIGGMPMHDALESRQQPRYGAPPLQFEGTLIRLGYGVDRFNSLASFQNTPRGVGFDLAMICSESVCSQATDAIRALRNRFGDAMPLIAVGKGDHDAYVMRSIGAGANEYIACSLSGNGLASTIAYWLRWSMHCRAHRHTMRVGAYELHCGSRTFRFHGKAIVLTQKQFQVAFALMMNIGRDLDHDHLFQFVWGKRRFNENRRLTTYIAAIRNRLELDGRHGMKLLTVHGTGYRLILADIPQSN